MYNRILRPIYIFIFETILGWKVIGKKPNIKKFVTIVGIKYNSCGVKNKSSILMFKKSNIERII
jgi:hypothetical protein